MSKRALVQRSTTAAVCRRTLTKRKVHRVAIVAGTHGNELNGILVAKFLKQSKFIETKKFSFDTMIEIANPAAVAANVRYCERDLNRCFSVSDLYGEDRVPTLELLRASELDKLLGPKKSENPHVDFIFDLHNTTSNSGVALMMAPDDDFAHELGAHLISIDSSVKIVDWLPMPSVDRPLVPSIARSGLTFEVGPCSWGCAMGKEYEKTLTLLTAALEFIHERNKQIAEAISTASLEDHFVTGEIPVFQSVGSIGYPRGPELFSTPGALENISNIIHPELQNRDFHELRQGSALFLDIDGKSITHFDKSVHAPFIVANGMCETEKVYAFFINEAAYYEKNIALVLGRRIMRKFERFQMKK